MKRPSKTVNCPSCGSPRESSRKALVCWRGHEPDLAANLTLERMGQALGVTREYVRQILNQLGEYRRYRQEGYPPPEISQTSRTYATKITEERREKWRVYQRERYRNDPEVRAAVKRRYDERWAHEPAFREAHRRRARQRYWRLKAERPRDEKKEARVRSDTLVPRKKAAARKDEARRPRPRLHRPTEQTLAIIERLKSFGQARGAQTRIAREFGLSRQRVNQLVRKYGLNRRNTAP